MKINYFFRSYGFSSIKLNVFDIIGLEYIHGERILQNNKTYSVDRLYLRTSYDF